MENHNTDNTQKPKTLLEEANGNYLLAFTMLIDRMGMPSYMKTLTKSIFLGLALAAALTALFWPFLMH